MIITKNLTAITDKNVLGSTMDGQSALIADLFTISYLVTKYNKCV